MRLNVMEDSRDPTIFCYRTYTTLVVRDPRKLPFKKNRQERNPKQLHHNNYPEFFFVDEDTTSMLQWLSEGAPQAFHAFSVKMAILRTPDDNVPLQNPELHRPDLHLSRSRNLPLAQIGSIYDPHDHLWVQGAPSPPRFCAPCQGPRREPKEESDGPPWEPGEPIVREEGGYLYIRIPSRDIIVDSAGIPAVAYSIVHGRIPILPDDWSLTCLEEFFEALRKIIAEHIVKRRPPGAKLQLTGDVPSLAMAINECQRLRNEVDYLRQQSYMEQRVQGGAGYFKDTRVLGERFAIFKSTQTEEEAYSAVWETRKYLGLQRFQLLGKVFQRMLERDARYHGPPTMRFKKKN